MPGLAPDPHRGAPVRRSQTAVDGALALMAILLVVQMWVLTAAVEAFLAGHLGAAIPGTVFSLGLLLANFGLYRLVGGLRGRNR
jgi:hypothetical protein